MSELVTRRDGCVFCAIVTGNAPATMIRENDHNIMITPLNPVVSGHMLVIPKVHVDDFLDWPYETGMVMQTVADWVRKLQEDHPAYESVNIITSVGEAATQTVGHFHVHVVPRAVGDGLALPWTGQMTYNKATDGFDIEQERLAQE